MKILCVICELWLVEPILFEGEVSYFCVRCHEFPPHLTFRGPCQGERKIVG